MVPPYFFGDDEGLSELAIWYREHSGRFETGFVLTMIAGLLNVLAIFDAAAGPIGASPASEGSRGGKKLPPGQPPGGTATA